jgi:hypothetical protein
MGHPAVTEPASLGPPSASTTGDEEEDDEQATSRQGKRKRHIGRSLDPTLESDPTGTA